MTNPITPQEAQHLIDGATPESESGLTIPGSGDHALSLAAPRLAKAIAADAIEYGIGIQLPDGMQMVDISPTCKARREWTREKEVATSHYSLMGMSRPYRIVARRVSPTWEVKE